MNETIALNSVITKLRRRYPAYHEAAYLFALSGLQYTIDRLDEVRHVTGPELAAGCRDLALEQFGPMARTVFEYWGVRTSRDLGEVVFALVNQGVLVAEACDSPEDFDGVFDTGAGIDHDYPWKAPSELHL